MADIVKKKPDRRTLRQKRVAKLIIENTKLDKPLTAGQILAKTGYAPGVVKNPNDIFSSDGVKRELWDAGFTEENATKVVREIMLDPLAQGSDRLKATDQVFKVQGTYAPEKRESIVAFVLPVEKKKDIDNILNDNE